MIPALPGLPPPAAPGAPADTNVIGGDIRHASYLGSETVYDVTLGSGASMRVLRSNVARYEDRGFADGDEVWLTWPPRSPAAVLS